VSSITNEDILRWLLELYRAARETPLPQFKDDVFRRLKEMIPLSSGVWADSGLMPDGGRNYFGLHMFQAPVALADELAAVNHKHRQLVKQAFSRPGEAHSFPSYSLCVARESAQLRDYINRYGHHNVLLLGDGPAETRLESFSLFRSRADDHFTTTDQRLLTLLAPHLTEALAISRQLSGMTLSDGGSRLAGTRALIQTDGVIVTCGERLKQLLRTQWPDWFSARLPGELMSELRFGRQLIPTRSGGIMMHIRKQGPYLFLQANPEPDGRALSPREAETAQLFASGKTYRQIAELLGLRPTTVRNVLQAVYGKLRVGNKPELVKALRAHPAEDLLARDALPLPRPIRPDGPHPATAPTPH
jgi:DNA-binding CsgD family transcriptional regulator